MNVIILKFSYFFIDLGFPARTQPDFQVNIDLQAVK